MKEKTARKRPFGIIVIIFIQLAAFISILADIYLQEYQDLAYSIYLLEIPIEALIYVPTIIIILYQTTLIYGLWQLKRWAWILIMIQLGIGMAISLFMYANGNPLYAFMITNVITVFYLNQRDVQSAFTRKLKREVIQ